MPTDFAHYAIFFNVTFKWTTDEQIASRTVKWKDAIAPLEKDAEARGAAENVTRLKAFREALDAKDRQAMVKAAGEVGKIGALR
jgi:hypothetical protein